VTKAASIAIPPTAEDLPSVVDTSSQPVSIRGAAPTSPSVLDVSMTSSTRGLFGGNRAQAVVASERWARLRAEGVRLWEQMGQLLWKRFIVTKRDLKGFFFQVCMIVSMVVRTSVRLGQASVRHLSTSVGKTVSL
jgi:hypothetical protein